MTKIFVNFSWHMSIQNSDNFTPISNMCKWKKIQQKNVFFQTLVKVSDKSQVLLFYATFCPVTFLLANFTFFQQF
jgi:hypothetical protein